MKKFLLILVLVPHLCTAAETCFQISVNKKYFAKTPELLCISDSGVDNMSVLTLKTGISNMTTVALFNLNLIQRAKCIDCNQDVYALANPSNSTFNMLSIKFNGIRKFLIENGKSTSKEEGSVNIGANKFYYRSF